ncbi:variable surface protein [Plasmodium gonderi]|uniref:Variable surface protein n=1 Tax=Plasmodium gonderi TaxID=77519 RepID=A0A1Y1JP00_PLAGO|nr:variable surface protein [Plasmodium gonderi]GAW84199.1 variable surface protein [Plasmodium gonderi]
MESEHKTYSYYYKFMNKFPYCEDTIQKLLNVSGNTYNKFCSAIAENFKFKEKVKNEFIQKICPQAHAYLYDININKEYAEYKKAGCRYYIYWLYDYLKKSIYTSYTKEVYEKMMSDYPLHNGMQKYCSDYEEEVTFEQLEELTAIYKSYKCIKKINEQDVSENQRKYCNALKNIIEENQKQSVNKVCEHAKLQISSPVENNTQEIACSCRSNIVNTIAATIIVTLLILFFLLFVFKYTSYGLFLRHRIKRIRKKLDNISNIWNISKRTEVPINILNSGIYDMLYNES